MEILITIITILISTIKQLSVNIIHTTYYVNSQMSGRSFSETLISKQLNLFNSFMCYKPI